MCNGAPCCHCGVVTFDPAWSGDKAYNVENMRIGVVCKSCDSEGKTYKDGRFYKCNRKEGCGQRLGRQHFDTKCVDNFNGGQGKLWCKEGTAKAEEEEEAEAIKLGGVKCCREECGRVHFDTKWYLIHLYV